MKHAAFAALTLCLFLGRSVSGSPVVDPAAPVFINEFHYDNDGTDTGEAIEIAGPAGTDLAGWKLVLYNGANGAVYNTLALTGLIRPAWRLRHALVFLSRQRDPERLAGRDRARQTGQQRRRVPEL